jgi:hypothetical protein
MNHLSEEELVLHYYGDSEAESRRHLAQCEECMTEFRTIEAFLRDLPEFEVPEPGPGWTNALWGRIEPELSPTVGLLTRMGNWGRTLAAAACLVLLIAVAFLAGRYWGFENRVDRASSSTRPTERMLALVLQDHLDRSQILLLELAHYDENPGETVGQLREEARDLLSANRIYRRAAEDSGSDFIEQTLENLERTLLQVANVPPDLPDGDFRLLLTRLDTRDLLMSIQLVRREITEKPPSRLEDIGRDKS